MENYSDPVLVCSIVVRKVPVLSLAQVNDWKTLTVHPAVNGYMINFREGSRQWKERIGPCLSNAAPKAWLGS